MATERQKVHGILTFYSDHYQAKFGRKPMMNRTKDSWPIKDLLFDYNEIQIREIMEYFFLLNRKSYDLRNFCNNFVELIEGKQESERLREERRKLLAQTKLIVEQNERG